MVTIGPLNMLKVGFVGCGNAAINLDNDPLKRHFYSHVKPLKKLSGLFVIHSAYDSSESALNFFCQETNASPLHSIDEFVKQDLDVLVVTTPTESHLDVIERIVLSKARVIVCEKPLGLSQREAENIVSVVRNANKKIYINYPRRYDIFYKSIYELIQNQDLGYLMSMVGYTDNSLLMNASHMIDLLLWFGGRPSQVMGHIDVQNMPRVVHGRVDYGGYALIKHVAGCTSFLKAANVSRERHMFELDLHFSDGRVRLLDDDKSAEYYAWSPSDQHGGMQELKLLRNELNNNSMERMVSLYELIYREFNDLNQDLECLSDVNFVIDQIYG